MITPHHHSPSRFSWRLAWWSGLLVGILFLVIPAGVPWLAPSTYSGGVMGRATALYGSGPAFTKILAHLAIAVLYGLVVCSLVRRFHTWQAVLMGGAVGLLLHAGNALIVYWAWPAFYGMEVRVAVTHLVFGLFAAAIYKGLTRAPQPEPSTHIEAVRN